MPVVKPMPKILRHKPACKGVFVGGCVSRGDGSSFRAMAHSHSHKNDSWKGWICVRAKKRLADEMLLLHELAHLISEDGHTDRWRKTLLMIGGTLDANCDSLRDYHKTKTKGNI